MCRAQAFCHPALCFLFCCHASNMSRCKKVTSTHSNGRVCVFPMSSSRLWTFVFPLTQLVLMAMNHGERRGDHSALCSVWSESCDGEMSVPNTFVFFAKMEVTCRDDGLIMCHNKLLSWTPFFLFVSSPLWMVNILSNLSSWNHMETQAWTGKAARGFKVLVQKTRFKSRSALCRGTLSSLEHMFPGLSVPQINYR